MDSPLTPFLKPLRKAWEDAKAPDDYTYSDYQQLKQLFHKTRNELVKATTRPQASYYSENRMRYSIIRPPHRLYQYYQLAYESTILRTCIFKLRQEVFRRGGEWIPRFQLKCRECGAEYDDEVEECQEEDCQGELRPPNEGEKQEADEFLFGMEGTDGKVNVAGQTLWDVLGQHESDLNITDEGYLVFIKQYFRKPDGTLDSELVEVLRGNPNMLMLIADETGRRGGQYWTCPIHRGVLKEFSSRKKARGKRCPKCGLKLRDVHYLSIQDKKHFIPYIAGEVSHQHKYTKSMFYGISPIYTLYKYAKILLRQEDYIWSAYDKKRMPSGVFTIYHKNPDAAQNWWDKQLQRKQQDEHYIPLAVQDPETGSGRAEFVNFVDTLPEMQYLETRKEMRERISALFGVTNVFMADTSTSGGLNNEGLQVTVTNRAIELAQKIYNDRILPSILDALGVEDWEFQLLPSEEEDQMALLEREAQRISNARGMAQLGFDVEIKEIDDQGLVFEYEKEQSSVQESISGGMGLPMPEEGSEAEQTSGMPDTKNAMLKSTDIRKEFWSMAIEALKAVGWSKAYEGLTKQESKELNLMLYNMFDQPSWNEADVKDKLENAFGDKIDRDKIDQIVRTEYTAVANKARELSYRERDDFEEMRFKWVGPSDHRTSDICEEIKKVVWKEGRGHGVKLDRLKQIIHDVSKKHLGQDWKVRDWTPHIHCRHKVVRVTQNT